MTHIDSLEITEFLDGDISIAEHSDTGTLIGEIYLSPGEQAKLLRYLQDKLSSSPNLDLKPV